MRRLILAALTLLVPTSVAFTQVIRAEDFSVPPAWQFTGSGSNSNDFGYRTTTIAGGVAGEAGGQFTRSNFDRIYADTNLGGSLNLAAPFSASGRLDVVNASNADLGPGLIIGHFNAGSQASIGLFLNQDLNSSDGVYLDAIVRFGPSNALQARLITSPLPNVNRLWSYAWSPTGGVLGGGRLSVTVDGPDGGANFIDLTPSELAQAPTFNAFGLYAAATEPLSGNPSVPTWLVEAYIDDLNYVTAIPEPGSCALLSLAVGMVIVRRVKPNRLSQSADS